MEDKELIYRRIKGLIEEFVGGRRKGITINHIKGQISSEICRGNLSKKDVENIITQTEARVNSGYLFPRGPLSIEEMNKRIKEIKNILHALT